MREAIVLFSGGAGAWELGAEWAGVRAVLSCEIDEGRRNLLRQNFQEIPHHDDITTLAAQPARTVAGRPEGWRPWLVCGSPPCQDASVANQSGRGLDGERTGLFRPATRFAKEIGSDWICFENVDGLKTGECQRILNWLAK